MYKANYLWENYIFEVYMSWSHHVCVRNSKGLPYLVEGIVHASLCTKMYNWATTFILSYSMSEITLLEFKTWSNALLKVGASP